jgi:hypothetical protein
VTNTLAYLQRSIGDEEKSLISLTPEVLFSCGTRNFGKPEN